IGTYAGFNLSNPTILGVDVLNGVKITTYLDGVEQEEVDGNTGSLIAAPTALLNGFPSRQNIGFITTKEFDEIKLTLANFVGVDLGVTNVYGAVVQSLCEATLACNDSYALTNPEFPVIINSQNTGLDGLACVGCSVENADNLLTADIDDYATIEIAIGVAGSGSISVLDAVGTYPIGTFAGFTIQNTNGILQADLLNSIT